MIGFIRVGKVGRIKQQLLVKKRVRYIPKDTSNADIIHLVGDGLFEVKDESNVQYLKITCKGIGIINRILSEYLQYLQSLTDVQSRNEYNHISVILSEEAKRLQLHDYIIHRENVFRDYLTHSNVFETHLLPSSLGLSQESRELSNLVSDLIDSLHTLNELCHSKFGCRIFKDNSKLVNNMRRKVDDELFCVAASWDSEYD